MIILDVRGDVGSPKREFLVSWQGYDQQSWEPRHHLHPVLINNYLHANNLYNHTWQGARCSWCDKACKNERGVKVHQRTCHMAPDVQQFTGTCAEKKVKKDKLAQAQKAKSQVTCEGSKLENVYQFKYLGSTFTADGETEQDVKRRIAMAMSRMGELRHATCSTQT